MRPPAGTSGGSGAPHRDRDVRPSPLPDFCAGETLLRVLMLAVLLALAITLLRPGTADWTGSLALHALFIFWVVLVSLLILCLLQRALRRAALWAQIVLPPLVPIVNTAVVQDLAERVHLADPELRLPVLGVAAILSLVAMHYLYLQAAWQRETRAVAEAREQAMRARLRPHFLYNSMNTIAGLCRSDPARAEQVTLDLADLFRAAFDGAERHTLRDELELVRGYLRVEQNRLGERLQLDWDCPEQPGLELELPALVLLPLVENAIQHGIAPARVPGELSVRLRPEGTGSVLEIRNSVPTQGATAGTGTATEAVRLQLQHAFGDRMQLDSEQGANEFRVRLRLPAPTAHHERREVQNHGRADRG
ncbi:sensor histidine kinase [Thioalkalivibrio sp. ALJ24]|uniref:sensor histidine kinase n=1 Tax=Thioalkalivibrio sp. ALJ24 TaxID=545276 RepID=UPI0003A14102|nr:sensor histidine kinase [Thioalkalivibrio sp. ALJ24]